MLGQEVVVYPEKQAKGTVEKGYELKLFHRSAAFASGCRGAANESSSLCAESWTHIISFRSHLLSAYHPY